MNFKNFNRITKILLIILLHVIILFGALSGFSLNSEKQENQDTLQVYSASAVRSPVKELARRFQKEHDIEVELVYGNSGELLSQIDTGGEGDVFIPGDPKFVELLDYVKKRTLAYHAPVLITREELSGKLVDLADIKEHEVDFLLVDPILSALGDSTKEMIDAGGLREQVDDHIFGRVGTASQVPMYMSIGKGDVGITWYSNYLQYEDDLSMIELPKSLERRIPIPGVVLSESKEEKGSEFLNLLTSSEGKQVFLNYGYYPE